MAHPGWPVELAVGAVGLRPPRVRDARAWSELRLRNERWLAPWEPSSPMSWSERHGAGGWPPLCSQLRRAGRAGTMLPFMIEYGDRLAGQVNVSSVTRGALRSCTIGYWIDQAVAGRGVMPAAVAVVIDHCLTTVGMHRVEIDIRPENTASLRVVEKLGLRREGYYERFLDIDGAWRDHVAFAITAEELRDRTLVSRLRVVPGLRGGPSRG